MTQVKTSSSLSWYVCQKMSYYSHEAVDQLAADQERILLHLSILDLQRLRFALVKFKRFLLLFFTIQHSFSQHTLTTSSIGSISLGSTRLFHVGLVPSFTWENITRIYTLLNFQSALDANSFSVLHFTVLLVLIWKRCLHGFHCRHVSRAICI